MNCESVERLLTLSAFEPLSAEDQRTVDEHVRSCDACRAKAAAYRVIASSGGERVERDADFWSQQRVAIMARISGPQRFFHLRWAAMAAAAIVLAVGLRLPRRQGSGIPANIPDVQLLRDLDMIDNLDLLESLKPEDLS